MKYLPWLYWLAGCAIVTEAFQFIPVRFRGIATVIYCVLAFAFAGWLARRRGMTVVSRLVPPKNWSLRLIISGFAMICLSIIWLFGSLWLTPDLSAQMHVTLSLIPCMVMFCGGWGLVVFQAVLWAFSSLGLISRKDE
jgi:hypothetical protein